MWLGGGGGIVVAVVVVVVVVFLLSCVVAVAIRICCVSQSFLFVVFCLSLIHI